MANYTIIGGDGKEYGSVLGEDLRRWIAEGRLNAQSLAKAESDAEFRPLSAFPEFADAFALKAPPLPFPTAATDAGDERDAALKLEGPNCPDYHSQLGDRVLWFQRPFHPVHRRHDVPPTNATEYPASNAGVHPRNAGSIGRIDQPDNSSSERVCAVWRNKIVATAKFRAGDGSRHRRDVAMPMLLSVWFALRIWALVVLNKPEVKSQFG